MIKYCQHCYDTQYKLCKTGYSYCWKEDTVSCPHCKNKLANIDFPALDLKVIMKISESKEFIEAMIDLYNKDIVEYQLKMSQFRTQVEQQKQAEESKKPHCPHCSSTNISSIGTGERVGSIAMWGIFSKKINKSFKCKNCGYTW